MKGWRDLEGDAFCPDWIVVVGAINTEIIDPKGMQSHVGIFTYGSRNRSLDMTRHHNRLETQCVDTVLQFFDRLLRCVHGNASSWGHAVGIRAEIIGDKRIESTAGRLA